MNIKRLSLQPWMIYESKRQRKNELLGADPYIEINTVFNRDGIYKQGKNCWFEVNGKAYQYSIQTFNLEQKILDVNEMDNKKIEALKQICLVGLATKKQKEILNIHKMFGKKLDVNKLRAQKRLDSYRKIVKQKSLAI